MRQRNKQGEDRVSGWGALDSVDSGTLSAGRVNTQFFLLCEPCLCSTGREKKKKKKKKGRGYLSPIGHTGRGKGQF